MNRSFRNIRFDLPLFLGHAISQSIPAKEFIRRPGIEKRRDNGPRTPHSLPQRELDLRCASTGNLRPEQCNRAGYKRCRSTGTAKGSRLSVRTQTGNFVSRRSQSPSGDRTSKVRFWRGPALQVAADNRNHPTMLSDGRAADGALVACRCYRDCAADRGEVERLLQLPHTLPRRLQQCSTQVDDPCAGLHHVMDGSRKLLRTGTRYIPVIHVVLREDRACQERTAWTYGRCRRASPCSEYARDKCSVGAGHTAGNRASYAFRSRHLADAAANQVRMIYRYRAIDHADYNVGSPS